MADKSEQLSSVFVLRIACSVPGGCTVYTMQHMQFEMCICFAAYRYVTVHAVLPPV